MLYVSHNMRTVSELCNRGVYLDHGRLTYDGTTERAIELYAAAASAISTAIWTDVAPMRAARRCGCCA